MIRIEAGRLIPGSGEPIDDGVVVIDGPQITYAGPAVGAPSTPDAETVTVPVAMPGLWDAHVHFLGCPRPDIEDVVRIPPEVAALRCGRDAERALRAGVTSMREVGGLGVHLRTAIDEGVLPGPTIYGAGGVLSPTGGHADLHALPLDIVRGSPLSAVCDGVPEVLRTVRLQLRRNARVIKLCASGGVMSEVDDPTHQQFSSEELRAAVEEAARAERVVAAHCHGKAGIVAALRAGVKTIEHGSYLDEEAALMMIDCDAVLVPTRYVLEQLLTMLDALPPHAAVKGAAIASRHSEAIRIAIETGVKIAMGTDLFVTGDLWGTNGRELRHLVEHGMHPLEAIKAGTVRGPETLGPQAPRSGLLAEGYDADVLALDADPVRDIAVLEDGSHVVGVWKGGVRV